jgi:CRP/FNR family cyclic AMP-dependent transcriptional regulator
MVQIENLGRILEEHPFAKGIDVKLKDLMVGCAANERFDAGQYLFREGQEAKKFYLIRGGNVAVEIYAPGRPPIVVESLHDGDVLGWSWLMPPHRWTFDARAVTLTRALSFDATCLTKKMESDPALGFEVMKRFVPVMAHRLHAARMQMLDLYGPAKKGK